ncbi:unnamed protein product [Phytophthora lilii]|uniref:Unnamed protein product n=1 Tax=Phytophthora lilii TaxID=2077276 RepID=A0A9W6X4B8_9STRA|nr:unnamed protein product [Phytophthora lilii]
MASDYEDDVLDDTDAICGWGAADFDDKLLGRGRRRIGPQAASKGGSKRKVQKALASSNSRTELSVAQNSQPRQQHSQVTGSQPDKKSRAVVPAPDKQSQNAESHQKQPSVVPQNLKQKPPQPARMQQQHSSPKPSPRTASILQENAAIAALGRQRRMKVVAAAMAANVPRKSGIASVVSASFDGKSDEEQEEPEMVPRRRPDEWLPSSAPQKQQEKLPRVGEPSTAPAGSTDYSKKIHPPLPLPLLNINPNSGGNETRLPGKNDPTSNAPRHWRRQRQQQSSLLASKDVSEHWESNFPPAMRRFRSPRNYQPGFHEASSSVSSSLTRMAPTPSASMQARDAVLRAQEQLPLIRQTTKNMNPATISSVLDEPVLERHYNKVKMRDDGTEEDDETWTQCYDDPEVLAKSMAGLIQALSTFAADGRHVKVPKGGKHKRRRAKLAQHIQQQQQNIAANPPVLRLPLPGEINVTTSRVPMVEGQQETEPSIRKRKHRKLRNKQLNDAVDDISTEHAP